MSKTTTHLYTAYLVTSLDGTFLNRRVYSGRIRGVWSPIESAHIFRSSRRAADCARDINRRSASGRQYASVTPVLLQRRAPKRA